MKTLAEIEKIKEEKLALCPFGMDMIYRQAWDDLMPLMLERENAKMKCIKCENKGNDLHGCPYLEEVSGDSKTLCNCCKDCTKECRQEI